MSISHELKLTSLPVNHQLKALILTDDAMGRRLPPQDSFIISRNVDGVVLSQYSDDTWDLSPYHCSSGECRLNFRIKKIEHISDNFIQQMKWIMISLMYLTPISLSTTTLSLHIMVIRDIAKYCHDKNIENISVIFSSHKILKDFIVDTAPIPKTIMRLLQIMSHISKAGSKATNISITNDSSIDILRSEAQKVLDEAFTQTFPIPSRIYLTRIVQLRDSLNNAAAHKDQLIALLKACINETDYGASIATQRYRGRREGLRKKQASGQYSLPFISNFDDALSEHGLTEFARIQGFYSRQSFSTFLTKLRYICKHQIHLFSGMRHDEVKLLQLGCIKRESMTWGSSIFLTGITTKLHKSRKLSRWVTCTAVEPAIDIAESISAVIAEQFGYEPKECSLFIPHTILARPNTATTKPNACIKFDVKKYQPTSIIIESADLDELERIDLNVDWRNKSELAIGKAWPFKYHQYRRSLAVYGSNSGLIELPSLKYQLKHITDNMALYYAQGSQRALDIMGDCSKEHFVHMYKQRKPVSDAIVFIHDYLMSNEPLLGGQGIVIDKLNTNKDNIFLDNREKTERRFKKGEISFKETPLGACTSTEKCDSRIQLAFTSCISCPKAILKLSKVDKFINEIENGMKNLSPESVEYRLEKTQLDDLKRLKNKITKP